MNNPSDTTMTFDRIQVATKLLSSTLSIVRETVEAWEVLLFGDTSRCEQGAIVACELWPTFVVPALHAAIPNRPYGGAHAKQRLEFGSPLRVGDSIETSVEVHAKYVRRGRPYVVLRSTTVNQNGQMVLIGETTSLWPG